MYIHRLMAVSGSKRGGGGVPPYNFQINIMTHKITSKSQIFTAETRMFTNTFEHTITPTTQQVTIVHLAHSAASIGDFTDERYVP